MAFVYLAFFDDGTAFPYLPVLSRDFLFGADTLSSLVKEHAAGSNLHIGFGEQPPLAENQMDMENLISRLDELIAQPEQEIEFIKTQTMKENGITM